MTFLPAIVLGLDALPHLINLAAFVSALFLLGEWTAGAAGPEARILAWVLGGVSILAGHLLSVAKNDLLADSCAVAGLVLMLGAPARRRSFLTGAVLLGCAGGMKFNGVALMGISAGVLVFARTGRGRALLGILTAAAVFAPWPIKTWLMMGDPMWPTLVPLFPGALMDAESLEYVRAMRGAPMSSGRFLREAWRELVHNQPAILAALPCLPFALWAARGHRAGERSLAAVMVAGSIAVAVAMPSEWARLAFPMFLLLAGLVSIGMARALVEWPAVPRTAALLAVSVSVWIPAGWFTRAWCIDPATCARYLLGTVSPRAYVRERRSTLAETADDLARLRPAGRAIGIGDVRFYRLPRRFMMERCYGRTWAWVLAKECVDPAAIRKRLRELGVTAILYNFVPEANVHAGAEPFKWNDRMLALWRAFVGRFLVVAVPPVHVDHANGGFAIYALRDPLLSRDPRYLPYLPGIESLYAEVTGHGLKRDSAGWLRAALELNARCPGVDYITDLVAFGFGLQERWAEAYPYFAHGVRHGMINDQDFWGMGLAAASLGRHVEARRLILRAVEISSWLALSAR
jgi:hypothetical protein